MGNRLQYSRRSPAVSVAVKPLVCPSSSGTPVGAPCTASSAALSALWHLLRQPSSSAAFPSTTRGVPGGEGGVEKFASDTN
jgi:hypothetical protein